MSKRFKTRSVQILVLVTLISMLNLSLVGVLHADRSINHRNKPPKTETEAIQAGWQKMPDWANAFHRRGAGNEGNKKYLPPRDGGVDRGMEAIYDQNGNLVTDHLNCGTYNYVAPAYPGDNSLVVVIRSSGHFAVDVLPYLALGNPSSVNRQ